MMTQQVTQQISRLISEGELEAAEHKLMEARSAGANTGEWLLLQGRLSIKKGQLEEACEQLQEGLDMDPTDRELMFELAFATDLHGEDDIAMELYERLVEQPPLHMNALINLAVLYEDRGRYDEAEICLDKVLEHYPNNTRARLFLKDVRSSKDMYYDEEYERSREKHNAVLDIPISDFELSVRSRNCLKKMNISTLGDLLNTTEAELLSYKNFGETSLNEIKAMLRQKGLRLGQALEEGIGGSIGAAEVGAADASGADLSMLNKPVSELELSVRARKCLQRLGVSTLGDLAAKTEGELLASKNFGQTSLNEVKLRLAENGLSLRKIDGRG